MSLRVHPGPARTGVMLLNLFALTATAPGQTTAPSTTPSSQPTSRPTRKYLTMSHDAMLREAAVRPLIKVEYRTALGKPLTDAEQGDVKKADDLMAAAAASRRNADFRAAAVAAREAMDLYQRIFGAANFLTTTALVETTAMEQFASLSPAERQDLAEADRSQDAADAATKSGDYFAARAAARKSLEIRERILGKSHAFVADALRLLGNSQIELLSLEEAQQSLIRAFEIIEATCGKNHPKTALILDRVGWLRIYQGKHEPAANQLRRAAWILRMTLGESADTAESLDNLGTALAYLGEFDEALSVKLRSLVIREALLGPEAKDTGISLSNLAWLYARIGKPDEVIPLRKRALAIFHKALGLDHHDSIVELGNLAQAYFAAQRYSEAAELYEQQIARDDRRTGPMEPGAVNRLMMLGSVYLAAGRHADGERTLKRALEKGIALYESGERSAAITELLRVAVAYEYHRRLEDSLLIREQIRKWDEAQLALATADTILRNSQLANLLVDLGCAREAREITAKAVGEAKLLFGEGEPETIGPMIALAVSQENLGDLDEAAKTCDQVLRIIESRMNRDSPTAVYPNYLLGRIRLRQGNRDLAKFALEEARENFERTPRKDPLIEIDILCELAACNLGLGDKDQALSLFRKAIQLAREMAKDGKPHRLAGLATALHQLLDHAADAGIDAKERGDMTAELRGVLEKLRAAKALNAEEKKWLQDLPS
ncbi:MAG TPA: tetratricopeptide repeat protein [Phycisphaerae bacterium]|nr:tetratricopeptide repeat protein [Phycisphaerae bacterium]